MKKTAFIYGVMGLIPFLAFGVLLPVWSLDWQGKLAYTFLTYSAIILAFLSGAVWGITISDAKNAAKEEKSTKGLTVGIVFSLVAVGALLMPYPMSLYLLTASFVILFLLEVGLMFKGVYPLWYTFLRLALTCVVVVCHGFLWYWVYDLGSGVLPQIM